MTATEIACLNHGYVALVDTMGDDRTPAQCARTSFRNAKQARTPEQDAKLTDYLIREAHTTPIEFCQVRFYIKCPMFVGEQILRHRTASINKISYRYVQATREFYIPAPERMNSRAANQKQGSTDKQITDWQISQEIIRGAGDHAFDAYESLIAAGLAPEIARSVLPMGTYTELYWQNDLHNLLHFLKLRLDPHAQYETRVYAKAMLELVEPIFPSIIASWRKHRMIEIWESK